MITGVREQLFPGAVAFWPNILFRGGGGGRVLTPNFGRYVPRQSEKLARAPENELPVERENGGLRNELEPF